MLRFGSDRSNNRHVADIVVWSKLTHNVTSPPSFAALRKVDFAERELWNIGAVMTGLIPA